MLVVDYYYYSKMLKFLIVKISKQDTGNKYIFFFLVVLYYSITFLYGLKNIDQIYLIHQF